ncbi:type II CAAX endopeptidase family protein [Kutzneria viridogrisea]|uniref:CAAX amino protease n=2 Tax=Kutzneria TaxID=43356 RepID=W5W5E0_9PSEU|nr:type II CAAX endopeptidase family protein [Kutzneria albida]AHH95651.1 CAAX amino protease [Kutzneria albida DSM 43870]MBA8926986.1 hypothetical protein [Kutzneria viridogrisea]
MTNPLLDGMNSARRPTGPITAVLVLLAAFLLGQMVIAGLLSALLGIPLTFASLPGQLFATVVAFGATLLLVLAWVRWREGRPIATVGFQTSPVRAVPGAVAGFAMFGVVVLIGFAAGQLRFDGGFDASMTGGVLLALLGFCVQGSTEEVLCRGLLMQAAHRKWGLPAAVAVQAVVFTALHLANPDGFSALPVLNLLLFAVFLAGWALWEGGLWGACAWHAVWNWTQGNVFGVLVSGNEVRTSLLHTRNTGAATELLTGGGFGLEGSLATTLVLAVGVAVVFTLYRRGSRAD